MKRLLLVLPLSITATFMLFSFMVWMVGIEKQGRPEPESLLRFDMFMLEGETQAKRHQRKLPEPPQKPEAAPQQKMVSTLQESEPVEAPLPDLPALAMDFAVTGLPVSAPGISAEVTPNRAQLVTVGQNQEIMPLHRIEPRYPPRALKRNIEGYVVLTFTIDKSGIPKDIEVTESHPNRIFDREARRALKRWKYQPQMVNGIAQEIAGQKVKLEFRIQN